jgi:hypothetical protein
MTLGQDEVLADGMLYTGLVISAAAHATVAAGLLNHGVEHGLHVAQLSYNERLNII